MKKDKRKRLLQGVVPRAGREGGKARTKRSKSLFRATAPADTMRWLNTSITQARFLERLNKSVGFIRRYEFWKGHRTALEKVKQELISTTRERALARNH